MPLKRSERCKEKSVFPTESAENTTGRTPPTGKILPERWQSVRSVRFLAHFLDDRKE